MRERTQPPNRGDACGSDAASMYVAPLNKCTRLQALTHTMGACGVRTRYYGHVASRRGRTLCPKRLRWEHLNIFAHPYAYCRAARLRVGTRLTKTMSVATNARGSAARRPLLALPGRANAPSAPVGSPHPAGEGAGSSERDSGAGVLRPATRCRCGPNVRCLNDGDRCPNVVQLRWAELMGRYYYIVIVCTSILLSAWRLSLKSPKHIPNNNIF